ncbi:hypothetical protein N6G02_06395 [Cupriavidus gilardii]|uniref:ApeI dehydratase-like domain-containing protein n=1 Tax=Cupriavidus gilardii TaxID=82541 RepID=A0ABY4VM49_9BURK|nr:hypothetical protein [Cupriavidus gilardii]MCT9013214.1 hypothetical protein [Cupriavidus gilardii]MCT9052768.1 hypothetical protein [Cupriavidus gilardii]MCT9115749.1 hypothetical protein [Cupriavidus gilardii]USE78125.1 hypothetical protein NDR89_03520 [Cupriavidus gilardii]UXC38466.1 hypothetical protein N4G38_25860 [Cupriavidus gilardii]
MNSAGVFTIEAGHPALPGHFPGQPIVPGVVLLDHAVLRIAAALGCAPQPCRLASVKFLATVAPNEPVMVRYASVDDDQPDHQAGHQTERTVRFELEGPGRTVASGTLTLPGLAGPTDAAV